MTKGKRKADVIELKELMAQDEDFLRVAVQALVQAALEAEMTQAIGAEKGSGPRRGRPTAAAITCAR
jgi:transposase-like protein